MTVTRVTTQDDVEEEFIPCVICPESVKRVLATMFDMSLITNKAFILVNISAFFQMVGYFHPYFFFGESAKSNGMAPEKTDFMLTVLGICNTLGRIGCGVLSSMPNIKALPISIITIIISGLAVVGSPFVKHDMGQFAMVGLFGLVACKYYLQYSIYQQNINITNTFLKPLAYIDIHPY